METGKGVIKEMSGVEEGEIEELSIDIVKTVPPVETIDADNNISETKEVKTVEADVNSKKEVDENAKPSVNSEKVWKRKKIQINYQIISCIEHQMRKLRKLVGQWPT